MVKRAHRRYNLGGTDKDVAAAWSSLTDSVYTLDLWGMDSGGVTHIPGADDPLPHARPGLNTSCSLASPGHSAVPLPRRRPV